MVLKFFDEFNGVWQDISGNTGSTLQKGVDSWNTSQGYLVYSCLLSQSGTDDPTYTELDNTTGYTITTDRFAQGVYRIIFSGDILSQGKTQIFIQQSDSALIQVQRTDINEVTITTADDGILFFTSLEIRIYN